MLQKGIRILEIILAISVLGLSLLGIHQINQREPIPVSELTPETHHVAIVTDTPDSYAFQSFMQGIKDSENTYGAVCEVYDAQKSALSDIFETIALTHVDGILLNLGNNASAQRDVAACVEQGIKVVAVGNAPLELQRDIYVGTNKYNMGRRAADVVREAIHNSGAVGIVLGSEYRDAERIATNNFVNGFKEGVAAQEGIALEALLYTHGTRVEVLMDDIIRSGDTLNALICSDPQDAMRIIRVLVDRNRVGDMVVIGSGNTPDILEALDKGMLYASLVEDHEEIGASALFHLTQLLEGQPGSNYVNVPFQVLYQSDQR